MKNITLGDIMTLITAAGVIVALIGNMVNLRSRSQANNPALIELLVDVKYIREKVDENQRAAERTSQKTDDIDKRVVLVEASVKSAHHRLDEINERMERKQA